MNKKHLYKKIIILFILLFLAESNNVVYADEYESDDVIVENLILSDNIKEIYEDGNDISGGMDVLAAQNNISWTVENNTIKYTKEFYKKAGTNLTILLKIKPSTQKIKTGYVDSEKKMHYVEGSSTVSKKFNITKSGNIKFFVKNTSGKKVTVAGYYIK